MKFVHKNIEKVLFCEVKKGEVINVNDRIYMKMALCAENVRRFNIVDLENGELSYVQDDEFVTPIECELLFK